MQKWVAGFLVLMGTLLSVLGHGNAEIRTISWVAVTSYVDGTAIEPGKTVRYDVFWSADTALTPGSIQPIATSISQTSTTFDPGVQGMIRGRTVYFTVKTVLSTGEESALSPAYAWVVPPVTPPPVVLTGIAISGPSSVNESSSGTYTATATWSDGTTTSVTPIWSEDSTYTTISAGGVLSASAVTSNQPGTVTASYTGGGVTKTATQSVTIIDVAAVLTDIAISGPSSVNENGTGTYTATATWDNGSTTSVTPAWSVSSPDASIGAKGVLTTTSVTADQVVTVMASYTSGGLTQVVTMAVTIVDVPVHPTVETFVGFTLTMQVPFSQESFETLSLLEPSWSNEPGTQQVKPFLSVPPNRVDVYPGNDFPSILPPDTAPLSADPAVLAPALSYSFAGPGTNTVIPPNTMGAAGPSHLVSAINSGIAIFDKSTGTKISEVTLQTFFASLNLGTITPFDPKIIYDQYSGCFIITAGASPFSNPNSWRLIAMSANSDPMGTWYKWAIDADVNNGTTQTNYWADYNGLGVDNNNIYTTANMFDNFSSYGYAKAWVIPKAQLLTGSNPITWTEFTDMTPGTTGFPQPAHAFGNTTAEYFIQEGSYSTGPARNSVRIASISFPGGVPTWTNLGHIEVNPYIPGQNPEAPQKDTSDTIDAGRDTRILNVLHRNEYLWATHGVPNSTNGHTEVAWYQIDPASSSSVFPGGSPVQQGRISDPNLSYYFPSIAVNANNDVGIGFSGSSASEFAGAFYTARLASDPAGTMQAVATLKAGEATYNKYFGGSVNRWGEYSATCVDPVDDLTFWTLQEYAGSHVGGNSMWGTWWGSFQVSLPPATDVTLTPSPASPRNVGTSVTWTAVASGGSGSYQYQFWLHNGTSWSIAKPYGATNDNTWTWNTTGLAGGTYLVEVWARSAGSTADMEANSPTTPYVLQGSSGPATAVTLTPSLASPQSPGTSVVWTASASGGSGAYEYVFWVKDTRDAFWILAQAYSASNTWTWNTTGLAGTYNVVVLARTAGSKAWWNVFQVETYVLQGGD